ncbi:triphosphoribosyl-dephospho-CoA synthase [Thermococcus sp. 21S9]|uniref:triphosphoribosyl-dephospho-CoA synthase n=1 Tax=Thermococcus sp. 21S9 TaxID=1638223 RepID=UPI001438F720|nr:triphosphoribosyl-dephospho-CoA synthase [Thermococcus sp. 21S9]NJE54623.1 apo-citrate lyase phosphoribosyl-dephospho-CoA transferase [Thermococcus sp. 21S9]
MNRWELIRAFLTGPLVEATVPKPGNVSRRRDFEDLSIYNFLVAYPALTGVYHEAIKRAESIRSGLLRPNEAGIGELIRRSVEASKRVQDANPNFGVIVLSIPLLMGLSMTRKIREGGEKAKLLLEESTVRDTMELYRAIRIANPKGLPSGVKYDVYSEKAFEELFRDRINLSGIAEISRGRELVFREWIEGYRLTYETFERLAERIPGPLEETVVGVFIELLAENLDTLILRKAGRDEAELVREKARDVVEGKLSLEEFDAFMREKGDLRNPGSLADVMAVSLGLLFLAGVRVEMRNGRAWLVTSRR